MLHEMRDEHSASFRKRANRYDGLNETEESAPNRISINRKSQ